MPSLLPLYRIASMSNGWFENLSECIRTDVLAHARERVLATGERLFSRGDEADGLYCVLEGSIRISVISRDGRPTVLDFYGPRSWFGEVSSLDGLPRIHYAHAQISSFLLQVVPGDLEDLLARHTALSRSLLRLQAHRLRLLLTANESYSTQSFEQRLANRLLILATSHGTPIGQGLSIDLHLPQETLAQLIGAARQRVNEILKEWKAQAAFRCRSFFPRARAQLASRLWSSPCARRVVSLSLSLSLSANQVI